MAWQEWLDITPFSWLAVGAALLCGSLVGLERQLRGKPVGIRTATLIVFGTYVFITGALSVATDITDPSRIIGQVITGIGFLGAGVMMSRKGVVIGVTSAAAIWTLAAIGTCIAIGKMLVAVKFSLLVVLILSGVDALEGYSRHFSQGVYRKVKTLIGNHTDNDD